MARNASVGVVGVVALICSGGVVIGCQQLRPPPDRNAARDSAVVQAAAAVSAKPAQPAKPSKAPRLAALVELPNGIEIGRGPFSARIALRLPAVIANAIMRWVGARQLLGARLARPIRLIVADPKAFDRPVAALLEVRDAAALQRSFPHRGQVIVRGDLALVGDAALVQALRRYAFDTVAALPVPKHPSAILFKPLFDGYENGIARASSRIVKRYGRGTAAVAVTALSWLAKQTQRIEVSADLSGGRLAVHVAVYPLPGSALSGFFAAQSPSEFRLLSKLPGGATPALLVAGHLAMGPEKETVLAFVRKLLEARFGARAPASARRALAARFGLYTGEFAAGEFAAEARGPHRRSGSVLAAAFAARNGRKVKGAVDAFMTAMVKAARRAGPNTSPGVHRLHAYRPRARSYRGVAIGEETITYDLSRASAFQKRALAAYARAPRKLDAAGVGKLFLVTDGDMRHFIDIARGSRPGYEPTGALAAQIRAARARKDSLLMALNLPVLLPRTSAKYELPTLWTLSIGFQGGALRLRLAAGAP